MTTYKTMDVSDLDPFATRQHLNAFRHACDVRQRDTDETDEAVTEWMWGDGAWMARVIETTGAESFYPLRRCVLCKSEMGDEAGTEHAFCADTEALFADRDPR